MCRSGWGAKDRSITYHSSDRDVLLPDFEVCPSAHLNFLFLVGGTTRGGDLCSGTISTRLATGTGDPKRNLRTDFCPVAKRRDLNIGISPSLSTSMTRYLVYGGNFIHCVSLCLRHLHVQLLWMWRHAVIRRCLGLTLTGYLSPGSASSLKITTLPTKQCRTTSMLVGKVFQPHHGSVTGMPG